ncbi:PREDICTED: uncharacterized protein LOC107344346 [Acropora digitifera]|uniref:uncharacterized protein LOC107344346 n=1 Tax=Acropora digitifera TaxID=70779 RepID=UPI00077AA29D|nr:PREDICTED: uncharacterized protein LOC107344346 [Acropora digitifera]
MLQNFESGRVENNLKPMGLTKREAFDILELPYGAGPDDIRSSYKRLALQWHPDKHANSEEATRKFQEVASAYKRLTTEECDDEINLSAADMFDLFTHIFQNGMYHFHAGMYDDDSSYSDGEYEDDLVDGHDEIFQNIAQTLRKKYDRKPNEKVGQPAHSLSEMEAMKNAKELIEEEEREKKKAEKRRTKKKRNKGRKKEKQRGKNGKNEKENIQEKNNTKENLTVDSKTLTEVEDKKENTATTDNTINNNTKLSSGLNDHCVNSTKKLHQSSIKESNSPERQATEDLSGGEEPVWDTSSAFFARAAGRNNSSVPTTSQATVKNNTPVTTSESSQPAKNDIPNSHPSTEQIDPLVLRSRQVAVKGNEMANLGNYQAAVEYFTEAINLDSKDFRSVCAVNHKLFQLYSDAEKSFAQVLKLDKHCEDAMFELARVRVQQLEEMGFAQNQSEAAIQAYGTVQAALEALLAGKVKMPVSSEIYVSDGEDDQQRKQRRYSESTSEGESPCRSLWVGNINPEKVSERHLLQLFSRCGRVDTVRILPKRYCAFVNYDQHDSAAAALEKLQVMKLNITCLRNGTVSRDICRESGTTYKAKLQVTLQWKINNQTQGNVTKAIANIPLMIQFFYYRDPRLAASKLSGPVNGDECYFWRTTGCYFAEKCKFKHVPESKGVDLRKVEAKYGGKLRVTPPNEGNI